jgi:hypothetical protein
VTWNDGAVILGKDLNTAGTQPRFIAEEARDIAEEAKGIAQANIDAALAAVAEAEGHADDAEASAIAAANNATLVEAIYDSFDDRYLGLKTSDPTTDNDGHPLKVGTLYFNTTVQQLRIYDGSQWVAAYIPSNNSVDSFNGRIGEVVSASGDYSVAQITGLPAALDDIQSNLGSIQSALDGKADESLLTGPQVIAASSDLIALQDASDGNNPKRATAQSIAETGPVRVVLMPFGFQEDVEIGNQAGAVFFIVPNDMSGYVLTSVSARHLSAGGGSGDTLIQVRSSVGDMLSERIHIEPGELLSSQAATQPTINTAQNDVNASSFVFIDVDQLPNVTAPQGLAVALTFKKPVS